MFNDSRICNMRHMAATQTAGRAAPNQSDLRLAGIVVRFTDQVKQAIREVGEDLGLSVAQLDVLRRLYTQGPTPMSQLAETMNCEPSNLTGLVDKLEARGLVERRADPADRRVRLLALTDEGAGVTHESWFAVTRRCPFMNLPSGQRQALETLLHDAVRAAEAGATEGDSGRN